MMENESEMEEIATKKVGMRVRKHEALEREREKRETGT